MGQSALAKPAGKAKMVIGKVMLQTSSGESIRLRRGKPVSSGDTIITNGRSQAQLIMTDGSNISVRPGSKFQISEYVATGDVEKDKTHYTLYKGGFRSVTGSIGKKNKASFKLRTPVATMGIRGTDFTAKFCNSDCPRNVDKNGLYVDVISGSVSMTNKGGSFVLNKSTNGFVANPEQKPQSIDRLPQNLLSPKKKKDKAGEKRYPSPEEEMVQIGVYVAPELKDQIIEEAMEAGVPTRAIINGASSGGLQAEDIVKEVINQGKKRGLQPSDFVQPILESDIKTDNIIRDLMAANPSTAADILTAAIASGKVNSDELKASAESMGINVEEINSAEALGNLLAIPKEVQEIMDEDGGDSVEGSDSEEQSTPSRIRARELAPDTTVQDEASPS